MNLRKNLNGAAAAPRVTSLLLVAAAVLFTATGCEKKAAAPKAPGPVEVGVVTLTSENVTINRELPGRTSAYRVAEVRARVNGIVQKRFFTEGGEVKEGEQLYQIDPAPYQAALDSAKGQLARTEANLASAKAQAERYVELVKTNAVSRQDYDNAVASANGFAADRLVAEAAVKTAQINLDYTRVLSPISGRIGKSSVTEGAYVQSGAATLLATVQQINPIYVDLVQPAESVLRLKADLESGKLQAGANGKARVSLFFDDGRRYPIEGVLEFSDISVSPSTSSITVRAVFENPKSDLLPGLFVRANFVEGVQSGAILAPQIGVTRNPRGEATALVVAQKTRGDDTKVGKPGDTYEAVEMRRITTSRAVSDKWVVIDGLKAGDQLIVENLQRIRPGAEIKTVPAGGAKPDAASPVSPTQTASAGGTSAGAASASAK